jgi:hypothetical protein
VLGVGDERLAVEVGKRCWSHVNTERCRCQGLVIQEEVAIVQSAHANIKTGYLVRIPSTSKRPNSKYSRSECPSTQYPGSVREHPNYLVISNLLTPQTRHMATRMSVQLPSNIEPFDAPNQTHGNSNERSSFADFIILTCRSLALLDQVIDASCIHFHIFYLIY